MHRLPGVLHPGPGVTAKRPTHGPRMANRALVQNTLGALGLLQDALLVDEGQQISSAQTLGHCLR